MARVGHTDAAGLQFVNGDGADSPELTAHLPVLLILFMAVGFNLLEFTVGKLGALGALVVAEDGTLEVDLVFRFLDWLVGRGRNTHGEGGDGGDDGGEPHVEGCWCWYWRLVCEVVLLLSLCWSDG